MKQKKQINLSIFVFKILKTQKMKSIKLFSIITILFLISSCSITKKIEKSIAGKWEITLLKTVTDEAENDPNNEMLKDMLFKKMLKGSYIEFNVDKTYELYLLGEKFNESWSVSEDGSKILSPKTDKYFKIVSKTKDTMVLKSINGTDKVIINLKRS